MFQIFVYCILQLEKWYKCHFSWWNGSWENCSVRIDARFSTGIVSILCLVTIYKCSCKVINAFIFLPGAECSADPWSFSCGCAIVYSIKLGQRIQEVASWYEYHCVCWYSCKSRGETYLYEFLFIYIWSYKICLICNIFQQLVFLLDCKYVCGIR